MTFYTFMIKHYLNSNSPEGDFARDMKGDKKSFPSNSKGKYNDWHDVILDYLYSRNACMECLVIFEECWEEYVRCEKKRLNRNL